MAGEVCGALSGGALAIGLLSHHPAAFPGLDDGIHLQREVVTAESFTMAEDGRTCSDRNPAGRFR